MDNFDYEYVPAGMAEPTADSAEACQFMCLHNQDCHHFTYR